MVGEALGRHRSIINRHAYNVSRETYHVRRLTPAAIIIIPGLKQGVYKRR